MLDRIKRVFVKPEQPIKKSYDPTLQTLALFGNIPEEHSAYDDVRIVGEKDIDDTDGMRRAISSINNYYNVLGIFRAGFDKGMNDKLANHPFFVMIEKSIMDYLSTIEYNIVDVKTGEDVKIAKKFIDHPNPQSSFSDILKPMIRDLIRYDAGVWVKTFNKSGYLVEIKPYLGTEFWIEPDRVLMEMTGQYGVNFTGFWTHGYVKRFWQRSVVGIYIPYHPQEICYFMLYPKSDDVYGTDFLSKFRSYFQFLIDSTKAAGTAFHNNLVPSMVLTHPEINTTQQLLSRVAEIESHNKGTSRFGNVLHLLAGESAQSISNSLIDMQWLEGQRFVGQLIWAAWGFPSSEFIDGDSTRASAYIRRNITKSKMLYPLIRLIEDKINNEVLPYLKGYKKSWKFRFVKDMDLDDANRMAQTQAIKISSYSALLATGMKPSVALKVVGLDSSVSEEDVEMLDAYMSNLDEFDEMMMGDGDVDEGRYTDESGSYMPIDFETNGTKEMNNPMDEDIDFDEPVQKARVYIDNPSDAPKGRTVRRGAKGGYYYLTEERKRSTKTNLISDRTKSKPRKKYRGGGGDYEESDSQTGQQQINYPDAQVQRDRYDAWFILKGDNFAILIYLEEGILGGKMSITEAAKKIANEIKENGNNDFEQMREYARDLAEQYGYIFKEG